jgi:hypothetical protein
MTIICLFLDRSSECRSIYRPIDPLLPEISVKWVGDSSAYILRKYHLEEYALFQLFDKDYFMEHILPSDIITFRTDPKKSVSRKQLTDLIDELLMEIKQGKHTFSHFTILQSKDYNFKKSNGLLIIKFNDYPFVVKLFVETPEGFVCPFDKGMEPIFFFFMAGGINRHLSGFTRIKNRQAIKQRITQSPWAHEIDIPRKWHWVPKSARWIEVRGKNIGSIKERTIELPGTYCIIADAIEADRNLSLLNADDKKRAMDLCNYLDIWIDPHMKNFMIEKGTGMLVIVDTEHFPTVVGLREKISFNSYSDWYLYLAGKCWRNAFMQTKWERRHPQKPIREMSLVDFNLCSKGS